MNARAFLIRGLLVGLLAGFATFLVAYTVGEPHVQRAIDLEEATSATEAHTHDEGAAAPHSHGEEDGGTVVSRHHQRTWGLLTGSLAVGVALGGIVALVSAAAVGRLGRFTPGQSTATVAVIGFVAYSLVPFLKYPATPPAVGNADTIGARTGDYFGFLLVSLVAVVAVTLAAVRLWQRFGALPTVVGAAAVYLVVMIVAGQVFATVNEIGAFPADTLWYFRRASLLTLTTLWAVIGIGLTWAVGNLHQQAQSVAARRELAASL